jgi:methyl-accepting chemotaxis protein
MRGEQQKVQCLGKILTGRLQELAETIQLFQDDDRTEALAIVIEGRGRRYTVEFKRLSEEISDNEVSVLAARQAQAKSVNRNIQVGMVVGGILALLLILGAATRTIAQIDGPLRDLMLGIAALADGHLERRVGVRSRDEIGKVASAFNEMADRLLAANRAREKVETHLATSNQNLMSE